MIPPTFVLTQSNPQDAASRIAIQNASVRLVLRKICPMLRTYGTSELGKLPSNSTRSPMLYLSFISFNKFILGPSPPIIKYTLGYLRNISGIMSTRRSVPLRYVNLQTLTMLILSLGRMLVFGVNLVVSTELGITKT